MGSESDNHLSSISSEQHLKALLKAAKSIFSNATFEEAARAIFDQCSALLGATSGYVALLSDDGAENKVLFLEAGGLPCDVDPSLPMPIRGLRGEAYRTLKPVYDNDFSNSEWMNFMPAGHVRLRNVMFVPLIVDGRTVGLMGIANKPADFTDEDASIAESFGEYAALALKDSFRQKEILDKKLSEQALRLSETSFKEAQSLSKTGSWTLDIVNNKLEWTDEIFNIFEIDKNEFAASYEAFLSAVHPDDRDTVNNAYHESLKSRNNYEITHRLLMKDGRVKYVHEKCRTTHDDSGRAISSSGTAQDITDYKNMEIEKEKLRFQLLQSQKMEAIGQLAGGMAHDFNNMLGVIMSATELARMDMAPDSPAQGDLYVVKEAVKKAKDLTMKLLTFARRDKIFMTGVESDKILDNLISMLNRTIPKNIELVSKLKNSDMINCDYNQIHQALVNICNNSVDAMPGGGKLSIESETAALPDGICDNCGQSMAGAYCLITVSDNGVGISKDQLSKITEPFYTTKGVGKGTGLGLSVTQGIIQSHGGHLHIYSEPGKGTCVKVYLPVSEKQAASENVAKEEPIKKGAETVLVVDDESRLVELAGKILAKIGYKPILAHSGMEAVELYRERCDEISVVILDLMMPGMDGAETNKKLKEINPEVKVIYASGFSRDGVADKLIMEKNRLFVQKPFEVRALCDALRELIDRKQ